jgi:hypothetical protein
VIEVFKEGGFQQDVVSSAHLTLALARSASVSMVKGIWPGRSGSSRSLGISSELI